jgi:hypothetical protein
MVPNNAETLMIFRMMLKMKKAKNMVPKIFDLKNLGIRLFLLSGPRRESNKLPWGQKLPHQYRPLKKDKTVRVSITGSTSSPSLGYHKPPIATIKVKIHPYLRMGVKTLFVLM